MAVGAGVASTGPFEGYDFRNAYAASVSEDGTGQSVGLFELFAYSAQDIQDYEDEAGIFPYVNVQPVLIDGASGDDSNVDYTDYPGYLDYAFEVTGDIEMAISMAPGLSSVLVYEGPTPQDVPPLGTNYIQDATTTAQINDVLNRMATDDLAKQLSCSYGFDINLSTVQIFQQYAAQGQSFFLASGDAGAFPGAIDEPADDPLYHGCGRNNVDDHLGRSTGRRKPLGSRQPRTIPYWVTHPKRHPAEESALPMASRPGNRASA